MRAWTGARTFVWEYLRGARTARSWRPRGRRHRPNSMAATWDVRGGRRWADEGAMCLCGHPEMDSRSRVAFLVSSRVASTQAPPECSMAFYGRRAPSVSRLGDERVAKRASCQGSRRLRVFQGWCRVRCRSFPPSRIHPRMQHDNALISCLLQDKAFLFPAPISFCWRLTYPRLAEQQVRPRPM